jgi:hypothetical protein
MALKKVKARMGPPLRPFSPALSFSAAFFAALLIGSLIIGSVYGSSSGLAFIPFFSS